MRKRRDRAIDGARGRNSTTPSGNPGPGRRLAQHIAHVRSLVWIKVQVFPAVGAVVALVAGILTATCFTDGFPTPVLLLPLILGTLVVIVCVPVRRGILLFFTFILGFVLMRHHAQVSNRLPAPGTIREWSRVSVRALNLSPGYPGIGSIVRPSRRIDIVLSEIRLAESDVWQPCDAHLVAYLGPNSHAEPLPYGVQVELDGVLCTPDQAPFPGAFDYSLYLRSRGISHVLRVEADVGILRDHAVGWRVVPALALRFRDWCAGRLIEHVRPASAQGLLLAMVFGLRECLEYGASERYLRSGAIHIFAVSGLHVGIVGLLVGAMLRGARVSFRWRSAALPAILAVYILMTGCSASSVRAWLMITIWSLSRALLLPPVPLNSVAFAALILLVLNPAGLFLAGFQFTFIIVSVLIMGWPVVGYITDVVQEHHRWRPRSQDTLVMIIGASIQQRAIRLLGAGVLAWFGSAMLVAHTNSLFIANALVTNILLGVIASCVLTLAAPQILLTALGVRFIASVVGLGLQLLIALADGVADVGAMAPGSVWVPGPPAWMTVAYYAVLFVGIAVILRHPRLGLGCVALCSILLLLVFSGKPEIPPGGVTLLSGGDARRPVLILERIGYDPVVINSGPRSAALASTEWLRRRGHDAVGVLVLTASDWASASGATYLEERIPVRTLVVPNRPSSAAHITRAVNRMTASGRRVRYAEPKGTMELGTVSVQYERPGPGMRQTDVTSRRPATDVAVSCREDSSGKQALVVRSGGTEHRLSVNVNRRQQFVDCATEGVH